MSQVKSGKLILILDDLELGAGLTNLAVLSSKLGAVAFAKQAIDDAELCYIRAEKMAIHLGPEDSRTASVQLASLRSCITEASQWKSDEEPICPSSHIPGFASFMSMSSNLPRC